MGAFSYTDLLEVNLGKLNSAVADWKAMVSSLEKVRSEVYSGLVQKSDGAQWAGINATVTKEFVRMTAKEFLDLHQEAKSIWSVLDDAHSELTHIQKQAKDLAADAAKEDPGLIVTDGGNGTVKVMEAMCTAEGTNQRTKDLMQWYADTLTGLVSHAAEIDAATTRALRKSHGGDPHNAGHATYTSLDEDMIPRALKLASLGDDANAEQRAEVARMWTSLSPQARAELWSTHKDDLISAGVMSPTVKRIAPDAGSGRHGREDAEYGDFLTQEKVRALSHGADAWGYNDAARHMAHYIGNSGDPMDLPVDKMMHDDDGLQKHVKGSIGLKQDEWRAQALEEFKRNGGKPVAMPVETGNRDYSFSKDTQPNWYYAVGSTRTNVTGVVTVTPGADGEPKVGLDYQVNAWDRYNWDENKGVTIGPMEIPDGEMGRLHATGLAQEFDMEGSSSVKHYDLEPNPGPLPAPDEPGRDGGRTDPGRERAKR
ncbi:hypothetical protein AB0D12_04525 [Streptomyces sp. NPDC048479]|uniref:hypothetical protein n=1 Tax=Streptomyces sp. NPDC048479 TaxID=3154725 RepID=UPI0034369971